MAAGAPPTVSSFLIADSVFQQREGKWCIVGVFDRIWAQSFPVVHPSLGLFLQLGDVQGGEHEVFMLFMDSQRRQLAVSPKLKLHVPENRPDPLTPVAIGLQTRMLPIPREGAYFIEVMFDGEALVGEDIRFTVESVKGAKG